MFFLELMAFFYLFFELLDGNLSEFKTAPYYWLSRNRKGN